jgi:GrpB-like predicted nucleotidyltransferase (UPF0157 family)
MNVQIIDYQPAWAHQFITEQQAIGATLLAFRPSIEHIGSTAVPGLAAKPIIDILVGLNQPEELDQTIDPMMAVGYTYIQKYEPQWPTRRFFMKLTPLLEPVPSQIREEDSYIIGQDFQSLVHIHVLVMNTPDWTRHIAFRDYLRAHPLQSQAYGDLKRQLSSQSFSDMNEYNLAKDSFVKQTERQALAWYSSC